MGWFKDFKGEVGWSLVRYFLRSAARTDLATLYRRAEFWARLGYLVEGSRRKTLFSNLSLVFPDWDARRVRRTAGTVVRNMGRGMVDLLYYSAHPGELRSVVHTDDTDVLAEVQSAGRGSVLITGHVGTFPWVGMPFVWSGRPYGVIARDAHDRRMADLFDAMRTRFSMISIADMPPAKA
ncbi:MAG: LpxL/LpxP family acyltransferase, partial [Planctomycetota bacterium]